MHDAVLAPLVSQLDGTFADLGKFQTLQLIGQATHGKSQRYLYAAVFDKGTQALMFYINEQGQISGFFRP